MPTKKQQIINQVTADVAAGRLRPGDRLPTTPELREKYDASIHTVRAAMTLLKAAGVVEFVAGVGMIVSAAQGGEADKRKETPEH